MRNEKVSQSLRGRYGEQARRWKGESASYYAIHTWIVKHWGKPDHCGMCHSENVSRYEWCNLNKKYHRVRGDWVQLCPSCHRKYDAAIIREKVYGERCRNGHIYQDNLAYNNRGHRFCRACAREAMRRFNAKRD